MSNFIHATAIIDSGAVIGEGTKIWHWSHVCSGANIGKDCSFGQNVYIGNQVNIGSNVKVQNNVSIYDGVTLEDGVFCGPSMVFTNVNNPRSEVVRKSEYRSTIVRRGATIGANATIVCGVEIGEYAFIAAGAVVNKNILPYELVAGVPAQSIGWMSKAGGKLSFLAKDNISNAICPISGQKYSLIDGVCEAK